MAESTEKHLGLKSGIGLVVANMVGAGVFVSAGFMAQDLAPGPLLLAWVVGAVLALCGVVAYAEVARLLPRSGGEYRFLSELWHPFLGYLAGWTSLLIGFSAPVAVDALAAGAFAQKLFPDLNAQLFGTLVIVGLTAAHGIGLRSSARVQNALFAVKVVLLFLFVALGVAFGKWTFPTWQPANPSTDFPVGAFAGSLFFIAFAFSGWNAAVYASEEFDNPSRNVPRAMLIGCGAVAVLYFILNYVFVANLTPSDDMSNWFMKTQDQITLGHMVMEKLVGATGARVFSGVMVLLFFSAMSAMTLVGPRVYAAMAADGVLPKALAAKEGHPPIISVVLQGVLAIALVFVGTVRDKLSAIGALLVIFAALTTGGLFRARFSSKKNFAKPSNASLVASSVYCLSAVWMLYFGFFRNPAGDPHLLLLWAGVLLIVTSVAFGITWGQRRRR